MNQAARMNWEEARNLLLGWLNIVSWTQYIHRIFRCKRNTKEEGLHFAGGGDVAKALWS